jgi:hypothetical protein
LILRQLASQAADVSTEGDLKCGGGADRGQQLGRTRVLHQESARSRA